MPSIAEWLTTNLPADTFPKMPLILLTNDDGVFAKGLRVLEERLSALGELWVVAPHIGRSACGRSVTLHHPLRVSKLGDRRFAVEGTPSDCVLLSFRTLLPSRPDIVVAGVNSGFNVGEDLDYSGTVGAAAEGALQGARVSVAFSVDDQVDSALLAWSAEVACKLVGRLLQHSLPPGTYLNVNLPPQKTTRLRWTRQGSFLGTGKVETRVDPHGRDYYWIGRRPVEKDPAPDTDRGALEAGCISLSLLTLDRSFRGSWVPPGFSTEGLDEVPG